MKVTIEVSSEGDGRMTAQRLVIPRGDYRTDAAFEAAAVAFIRKATEANEVALRGPELAGKNS